MGNYLKEDIIENLVTKGYSFNKNFKNLLHEIRMGASGVWQKIQSDINNYILL